MAAKRGVNQGKTAFLEQYLPANPDASVESVNEAWRGAGNEGSISDSLISKIRSKHGLTGERGAKGGAKKAAAKGKARATRGKAKSAGATAATNGRVGTGAARAESTGTGLSDRVVDEVEAGIDDLMYTIKASGGHPEAEEALRSARRLLTRSTGE